MSGEFTQDFVPPKDLKELMVMVNEAFSGDRVDMDYMKMLLESYRSKRGDWEKYAKFDPHRYTRNLIDEGNGKFNAIILCWGEGHGSAIHDHSDAECFVKILDGQLKETMFEWPSESEESEEMVEVSQKTYDRNGVTHMNDEMGLHRMENPSNSDKAVTLHIYYPPFDMCQAFDERSGHKNTVKVTYWSKFGTRSPFTTANQCVAPAPENN